MIVRIYRLRWSIVRENSHGGAVLLATEQSCSSIDNLAPEPIGVSDSSKPFECVRKMVNQKEQDNGLSVRLCPSLLPSFQGPFAHAQPNEPKVP